MSPTKRAYSAGNTLLKALLARLDSDRGVHLESAAVALGALAGHACQLYVLRDGEAAVPGLMIVTGANGDTYYYGESINGPLVESADSVWMIVSGAATSLGADIPDVDELFQHAAATVGGPDFGKPRYEPGTYSELPIEFLPLWEAMLPSLSGLAMVEWPVAYALALAGLFVSVDRRFPIEPLVRISMDAAIAMAKLKS